MSLGTLDVVGLGRFEVELGANYMQLRRDLDRAKADMGGRFAEMQSMARNLNSALGTIGVGVSVGGIVALGKELLDAKIRAEALRTTLDFASGGRAADEMVYLRKVTRDLGLEYTSTAGSYAKFLAASRGTALEGQAARGVYEAVSKAVAVMGLSAEQGEGALLALTQMVSKGTVQSEELRGQLGERLPGAFQIAARAMGVSTEELGKMLEQGLVPASAFLPKFAKQLETELGASAEAAANRTEAAVNRLKNAAGDLGSALVGDGTQGQSLIKDTLNAVTWELENVTKAMRNAQQSGASLWETLTAGEATLLLQLVGGGIADAVTKLDKELKIAEGDLKELQARFDKFPGFYLGASVAKAQELVDKLREAKRAQDELERTKVETNKPSLRSLENDSMRRLDAWLPAEQAKAQQALNSALSVGLGVNASWLKQITELNAYRREGLITQGDYINAVQVLTKETYHKTDADKAAREAGKKALSDASERLMLLRMEAEQGEKATDGQKFALNLMIALRDGKLKLNDAEKVLLRTWLEQIVAKEQEISLDERKEKALGQLLKGRQDEILALGKSTAGLHDQVREQQAANLTLQTGVDHTSKLTSAKLREAAATQELMAIKVEDKNLDFQLGAQYRANAQALRELADAKDEQSVLKIDADRRRELEDFLDPGRAQAFGDALTGAFARAGNSLAALSGSLRDYARQRGELDRMQRENDKEVDPVRRSLQRQQLIQREADLQIDAYANMAGAAKGFFAEGSRGYKAMEVAENAFRAVQLASDLAKGISAAAVGIANQAQGEPYTALPRMALMAAAMASLGFATGFFGSSGSAGPSAADRQKLTGTGTVFGDPTAKSDSIGRSIDMLADSANLQVDLQSGMLSSLRNIESNIGGLASLVLRSSGLTTGKNLGITEGTLSVNSGDPLFRGTFGSDSTDLTRVLLGPLAGVAEKLQSLWGKTTQKITDAGLSINGTIADLIGGRGVQQYADVATTTSSWFGLKKSTTNSTVLGDVDEGLTKQVGLIFSNLSTVMRDAAGSLGRDSVQVSDALANFVVDIDKLSLKDLKGTDLQEAISTAFSAASDSAAKAALPGLDAFQHIGEGYFETLVRVSSGVETADSLLSRYNITLVDYTTVQRKQGDITAELVRQSIEGAETMGGKLSSVGKLIDTLDGSGSDIASTYGKLLDLRTALRAVGVDGEQLTAALIRGAGSLDELDSSLSTYSDRYFTQRERFDASVAQLGTEFGKLGLTLPQSRAEFRGLVDSLKDASPATQELLGKVLGLSDSFDKAAALQDTLASKRASLQVQLLRLQGNEQGALNIEREHELQALRDISPELADLQQSIYDLGDAATASADEMQRAAKPLAGLQATSDALKAQRQSQQDAKVLQQLYGGITNADIRAIFTSAFDRERFDAGTLPEVQVGAARNLIATRRYEDMQSNKIDAGGYQSWLESNRANGGGVYDDNAKLVDEQNQLLRDHISELQDLISTIDGLRKDLADYQASLMQGDLSILSPEQKYAEAKAAFDSVSRQAMAGDQAALEALRDNADTLLRNSHSYFGSTAAYAMDFDAVVAVLNQVADKLASMEKIGQASLAAQAQGAVETVKAITQGNNLSERLVSATELAGQRNVE